jgi:hypothetical protein
MKLSRITFAVVVVFFLLGGSLCGWIMDDNNLLQGANTQDEVKQRLSERRSDIVQAFLIGGFASGISAGGVMLALQKFTNRSGGS